MGQYYKAIILSDDMKKIEQFAYSHDFGSGLKLMEHSWIGNNFVGVIEKYLADNPKRLSWCGDYADANTGMFDNENEELNYYQAVSYFEPKKLQFDEMPSEDFEKYKYNEDENIANLYWGVMEKQMLPKSYRYLINHDKKEYVDKENGKKFKPSWNSEVEYQIHPLPLITCEGNGRGGGDFRDDDPNELVGLWARDMISISETVPDGFQEVIFDLVEG